MLAHEGRRDPEVKAEGSMAVWVNAYDVVIQIQLLHLVSRTLALWIKPQGHPLRQGYWCYLCGFVVFAKVTYSIDDLQRGNVTRSPIQNGPLQRRQAHKLRAYTQRGFNFARVRCRHGMILPFPDTLDLSDLSSLNSSITSYMTME